MKPQLVPTEKLKALEDAAERKFAEAAAAARSPSTKERWLALDRLLTSLGDELRSLLIIFLALAILCAPVGLGLGATYYLSAWAARATGQAFAGWIVAIFALGFLCRYVWGVRLQRAARRAAEALIAKSS